MQEPIHPKSPDEAASAPPSVPVFNCVVYLAATSNGGMHARVANLDGLECDAPTERAALQAIVAMFKRRVAEMLTSQTSIPWIEPPLAAGPHEKVRLIGVHL